MNKALYKVTKKFKQLGGGYVEIAREEFGRDFYMIKYQIARKQKSGKHRDWLYFSIDEKGNVEIIAKAIDRLVGSEGIEPSFIERMTVLLESAEEEEVTYQLEQDDYMKSQADVTERDLEHMNAELEHNIEYVIQQKLDKARGK